MYSWVLHHVQTANHSQLWMVAQRNTNYDLLVLCVTCEQRPLVSPRKMFMCPHDKSAIITEICLFIAEGLAQWLRSMPPNPEVPGSIPGLVEGWLFGWPSFPLKFTQLSILPGSVKWVPAYMDRFEAAARGAYICFRSAGGKLIIVKRLWACYMEKALYKCTTLLYFTFYLH